MQLAGIASTVCMPRGLHISTPSPTPGRGPYSIVNPKKALDLRETES